MNIFIASDNIIKEIHSSPTNEVCEKSVKVSKQHPSQKSYSAHTLGDATSKRSKTRALINRENDKSKNLKSTASELKKMKDDFVAKDNSEIRHENPDFALNNYKYVQNAPIGVNQLGTFSSKNIRKSLQNEFQNKRDDKVLTSSNMKKINYKSRDSPKIQFSNAVIQKNSTEGYLSVLTDSTRPAPNKRPSIAIRRTSSGNENLTFLEFDSESQMQLPKTKLKKLKKLRRGFWNCFSTSVETEDDEETPGQKHLSKDRLAKAIFKQKFTLKKTSFQDLLLNEISEENQKCLCLTAAYTVSNYIGKPGPRSESQQQLSVFINEIISLPPKIRNELIDKAKSIKGPPFVLNLKIIEAKNLTVTDPDGTSDPFCKIWIKSKEEDVRSTEIKEHTVDPKWEEEFSFPLKDATKEVLHIEIWDRDPIGILENLKLIRNVKGMHGCFLFCTDFFDNICTCRGTIDDFIGKTEINIGNIYSEGIDQWLPLKTQNEEDHQGDLHIAAKIEVSKPKDTTDALKRHFLLVKLCIEHGMKDYETTKTKIESWEQILKSSAHTLLFQHGVQGNISILEDVICRFVVLIHSFDRNTNIMFDNKFLYTILKQVSDSMQSSDLLDNFSSHPLEGFFKAAVEQLKNRCFSSLYNFHSFRLVDDPAQCSDMEYILKIASSCEEVMGFSTSLELWSILKLECRTWLESQIEKIQSTTPKEISKTISIFLRELRNYHKAADGIIQEVFFNKIYTQLTFDIIDEILSKSLQCHIIDIAQKSRNSGRNTKSKEEAFEVFTELKKILDYLNELSISDDDIKLSKFYEWFNLNTILDWFLWRQELVSEKIYNIVTVDDLENKLIECGDRYEKQSDSPKKTSEVIQKDLVEFWNLVHHSQYPECDKFYIKSLNYCSMKYASGQIELIYSRKLLYTEEKGKKGVCVIANNLWSLATFISKITPETENRKSGFPNTKFSLQTLCKIICADLSQELTAELRGIIDRVTTAKTKNKQHESLLEYKNFIKKTFKVMATTEMAFEIYLLFSHEMWKLVLKEVSLHKEAAIKIRATCMWRIRNVFGRAANLIEGLISVLKETEKVFYFDKAGKLKKIFFDDEYNNLKKYLGQKLYHE